MLRNYPIVHNECTAALTGLAIGAVSDSQFTRTTTCVSGDLAAGGSRTVTITVNPTAVGTLSDTIEITPAPVPSSLPR